MACIIFWAPGVMIFALWINAIAVCIFGVSTNFETCQPHSPPLAQICEVVIYFSETVHPLTGALERDLSSKVEQRNYNDGGYAEV